MKRLLPIVILILLCSPVLAQQEDRRVSVEPLTTVLPEEIRIQAAASIGANTIVVWGGNRSEGRDTAISNLQGQILRDTIRVGAPRQIHSDAARPFGYVAVVPFDDRYLVLWNDRRDNRPGLYMRWIDSNGAHAGGEEIITREIGTPASIRMFRTGGHTLIFYSTLDASQPAGLYLRRFLHDGSSVGSDELIVEGTGIGIERLAGFDDLFAVRGDSSVRVFRAVGGFDSRAIPAGRFDHPWYLGADSSFVTLVDTTLHYYSSLFAPAPMRSVRVTGLRAIDGSRAVLSAGGNNVQITFPAGGLIEDPSTYIVTMQARRITVSPDGAVSGISIIDSMTTNYGSGWEDRTIGLRSITTEHRCGNTSLTRIIYHVRQYSSQGALLHESFPEWRYLVDGQGNISSSVSPTAFIPCFDPSGALIQHVVERTGFAVNSMVAVASSGLPRIGSAINGFAMPVDQGVPNIFRRGGRLMTTWRQEEEYPPNILAEWKPRESTTTPVSSSLSLAIPMKALTTTILPFVSVTLDYSFQPPRQVGHSSLYMADSQWSNRYTYASARASLSIAVGADQNRNESVTLAYLPSVVGFVADWVDSSGFIARSVRQYISINQYPRLGVLLVPVDSLGLLVYGESSRRFFELQDGVVRDSFSLDLGDTYGTVVRRLYGSRFLCFRPALGLRGPQLTIYSLKGKKEAEVVLPVSRTYLNPFIVESPVDSSIHLLWESDRGVRMTRLDRYLRLVTRDSMISRTGDSVRSPAGIFRNDTLFVVWQDFRNTTADIYGTTLTLRHASTLPLDTTSMPRDTSILTLPPWPYPVTGGRAVLIQAVTPHPANDIATFFVAMSAPGDAVAEIRDVSGQVVVRREKTFDMDSGRWDIDIADLASGMYILSVRSGGGVDMRKLVVVKR